MQKLSDEKKVKFSYFDFLLDKSGNVLKSYLENENIQEPAPLDLCKLFIEKSLLVATTTSQSQGATEEELKIYSSERIWQPLCIAMTIISHLKWDLHTIQKSIPLQHQQILMEELLKGYSIPYPMSTEGFEINKLDKRSAMVYIIYNRWIIKTISKYEEMKERDLLQNNISISLKEVKENQEEQLFSKIKEHHSISLDLLEKCVFLDRDVEIPYPRPRVITQTEILPFNENDEKIQDGATVVRLPEILDVHIPLLKNDVIKEICTDLGCYYFQKEQYNHAWRHFQKVHELSGISAKDAILQGYYEACSFMVHQQRPSEKESLQARLEQCASNEYTGVTDVLCEDNMRREIAYSQRVSLEKKLYMFDKRELLFHVCTLNYLRATLEDLPVSEGFLQSLDNISKREAKTFFKICREGLEATNSENDKSKIINGVRLAFQFLSKEHRKEVSSSTEHALFFPVKETRAKKQPRVEKKLPTERKKDAYDPVYDSTGSATVARRKARLLKCFDPETIKDILYSLHDDLPEKSHAAGYECAMYGKIFLEVQDLLMQDTVHICVAKARHLCKLKDFKQALSLLNICVETLDKYAQRASPGCSGVARVKNVLHHELLWTEIQFAEHDPDSAKPQEALRRSKACIQHRNVQDPPPRAHITEAILVHLLNHAQHDFLVELSNTAPADMQCVDYIQLSFHISTMISSVQRGNEALRAASRSLWEAVLNVLFEGNIQQNVDEKDPLIIKEMQCYITSDSMTKFIKKIKDENILSIIVSCLCHLLSVGTKEEDILSKDSYTHLWPSVKTGRLTVQSSVILSILHPLCSHNLSNNPTDTKWLRTLADVYLAKENYNDAMKGYLEVGSISTSFFSRPVPYSVWDEKVYKNMIRCCEKQNCYTQVMILCQFMKPIDYDTAFKAARQRSSVDGLETCYDFLWDVNILEYVIYCHNQRGEKEKKRLAVSVISQPELNCRDSSQNSEVATSLRKTSFLRSLCRKYWTQ